MNKTAISQQESAPGKNWFRSAAIPLLILTVVTLTAFANAWPNVLVLDDPNFVGPQRPQDLDNLIYIFTHHVWSAITGTHPSFYRPLLVLSLSIESWMFDDWLAGYHLSNILYHLLASLLTYGFFRYLLDTSGRQSGYSDLYALLAALVFAVHPIHTETVNSIFNRSDIMVTIFGLGGIWWLLHHLETYPARAWLGLGITYFLALLSKENAAVIPGVAVCLILLMTTGEGITRIRKCLPVFWLLLPLAAYLALRAYALAQPGADLVVPAAPSDPGTHGGGGITSLEELGLPSLGLPSSERLLALAGVLSMAIKLLIWPHPLMLYHPGKWSLGLMGGMLAQLVLILVAGIQIRRKHYSLAAGLAFFYLAMLPSIRVFAVSFDVHVTERYLYFPSAGLAMTLAFAFRAAAQRFGPRVVLNILLPVLLALTVVTWGRNAEWGSDRKLFETDYERGNRGHNILRLLTSTYIREKDYTKAAKICDDNWKKQAELRSTSFPYYCSIAYEHQQRIEAAERVYRLQIEYQRTRILASRAFAKFYVRQNRPKDAVKHFVNAINWTEDPAIKAFYTAEMMLALNPNNREQLILARRQIQEALRLHPGWDEAEQKLKELNRILD